MENEKVLKGICCEVKNLSLIHIYFARQLAVHNRRSNNFPMRPLNYCSPSQFAVQYV